MINQPNKNNTNHIINLTEITFCKYHSQRMTKVTKAANYYFANEICPFQDKFYALQIVSNVSNKLKNAHFN